MGYRPTTRPNVQHQMKRARINIENNSVITDSQGSVSSTSRSQYVITSTTKRPKPSSSDRLDSSDSKTSNEKEVAYPKRVPQPTIVVSSEEEDIKPEVHSQNNAKVNEENDTIQKRLDQDLDDYWKEGLGEEEKGRPLKKRNLLSTWQQIVSYHMN
ncbi:unnamed protein product [Allacma fusca]|uniref:Uncharacterized protein n=1 Tax=Allacma fusca TaxID=39272 RepID=A0A8J2PF91_9HEXA|nr:unnamed protein product [Allacma fusca]